MSHELSRRGFLAGLGAIVAGVAIEQAIPLGRVWSFPSNIVRCSTVNVRIPARYHYPLMSFECSRLTEFYRGDQYVDCSGLELA